MKYVLCVLFLLNGNYIFSQFIAPRIGFRLQAGSHMVRAGIMYQLVYHEYRLNIVQSGALYYNFKNLGPPTKGFETKINAGAIYNWGNQYQQNQFLFSDIEPVTDKQNSAGYMTSWFYNKTMTGQWLGKLFFRFKEVAFIFENDFLGFKGYQDKYRTAAIAATYTHNRFRYSLKSILWTGNAFEGKWVTETDYPAKHGYKNLENATYGKFSHGILAVGVDYSIDHYQVIGTEAGIDAEQVRHALQNRFMHDILLNEKIVKVKNPHYPMLQEDGSPYLFEEGRHVRAPGYYFQVGMNPGMFY